LIRRNIGLEYKSETIDRWAIIGSHYIDCKTNALYSDFLLSYAVYLALGICSINDFNWKPLM